MGWQVLSTIAKYGLHESQTFHLISGGKLLAIRFDPRCEGFEGCDIECVFGRSEEEVCTEYIEFVVDRGVRWGLVRTAQGPKVGTFQCVSCWRIGNGEVVPIIHGPTSPSEGFESIARFALTEVKFPGCVSFGKIGGGWGWEFGKFALQSGFVVWVDIPSREDPPSRITHGGVIGLGGL